ncbi:hypothetical protein [Anaerorhabdus sp.]|uniref:hypothetical protein n=1 Tax=Anaerorhabdus sp. TaxID=1872524 RepID=UPI002FCA22FD
MKNQYNIYWTDMHSNIHHEQINELEKWYEQVKATMDFWPIAYYPYTMRKDECGLGVEDIFPSDVINKDWELIRDFTNKVNQSGYPMFMGYEWQGAGLDGDHNVFFKDNQENMAYPLRYTDLVNTFKGKDAIGIPHHLAYHQGDRGKNWSTHDETFSPVAEIYSSHGSSENDNGPIEMTRHVHMGPRTGKTCVEAGLNKGKKIGVIAAGDNHSCPSVYGFGYCAVLAKSPSKEDIWDALINRRTYGVSKDKIKLNFTIDGSEMGSIVKPNKNGKLSVKVNASNAIDRIEIIKDNVVDIMIPHTSTWEKEEFTGKVKFKFQLELGWGPDRRIFPDIESRKWVGKLETPGKLLSVEKCWSTFGQSLDHVTDHSCEFNLTSYKTTATGKWMGPSAITTEGFIFEIEDDINSSVKLIIDGIEYNLSIRDIIKSSDLIPLMDEARMLLNETFGFNEYYRTDPWWHNAYKIKVNQAAPSIAYEREIDMDMDTTQSNQIRVRVWQKNGAVAWSSPIFIEE